MTTFEQLSLLPAVEPLTEPAAPVEPVKRKRRFPFLLVGAGLVVGALIATSGVLFSQLGAETARADEAETLTADRTDERDDARDELQSTKATLNETEFTLSTAQTDLRRASSDLSTATADLADASDTVRTGGDCFRAVQGALQSLGRTSFSSALNAMEAPCTDFWVGYYEVTFDIDI